jgi:hypothetical protein
MKQSNIVSLLTYNWRRRGAVGSNVRRQIPYFFYHIYPIFKKGRVDGEKRREPILREPEN